MTFAYGDSATETDAISVIHRAIDLGVTLIDTADVYGPSTNEELVGKALQGWREKVVLATKCGLVEDNIYTMKLERNGTPEHIRAACEASLKRLGVDVIDLYQLHRVDPNVPIEDSVGAMADLVKMGKVRAIGLSECDISTLERAIRVHPIASLQSEMSLWTRGVLPEILPWCKTHNAAVISFSPLGRGFLSGKYTSTAMFGENDIRSRNPRFQAEALQANLEIVRQINQIAQRHYATNAQIALAWALAQGEQVIPIPGTRRIQYLEENVHAVDVHLTPADLAALDQLPTAIGGRY